MILVLPETGEYEYVGRKFCKILLPAGNIIYLVKEMALFGENTLISWGGRE